MPSASRPKPDPACLAERARGAYLGLAVGDALGATVEFLTPREIQHQFARQGGVHRDIVGAGWLRLKPGQVTDDTHMSLALGEAILACAGRVDALACARAFDAWMRAKPIDIGNTVRRNLVRFRRSGIPEAPPSPHDAGNGAIMRALPVALARLGAPAEEVATAFCAQAHVTHHNALSDAGGICLTLMLQEALLHGTWKTLKHHARALAQAHAEYAWEDGRRMDNPSGYVAHTLPAVFQAFFAHDSFAAALIDVVNRGGDADTTGAILGALAGAWYGEGGIPAHWRAALDPDVARCCATQAEALLRLAPMSAPGGPETARETW